MVGVGCGVDVRIQPCARVAGNGLHWGGQMQDEVREMNERELTNPNAAKRGEMRETHARRIC